jgi:signal transduction histidine kinase
VLIQNGLDAAGPDGPVHVRIRTDEDQVRFEIWNDGAIPLQHAEERVFIPFFTTKANNLGVGLSIARQIAHVHHGRLVLAHNAEPKGTCFTLTLPLVVGKQRKHPGT